MTSTRSLLHRLTPFITNRIRQNQRLLSSALKQAPPSSSHEAVQMTDSCIRRLKELHLKEAEGKMLRLSVETGGCSGFQYVFLLDDKTDSDDRVFEKEGVKLVVDKISHDFVKGATVDYVEELIRSAFVVIVGVYCLPHTTTLSSVISVPQLIKRAPQRWLLINIVTENPSAVGGCSCKSSFMVK